MSTNRQSETPIEVSIAVVKSGRSFLVGIRPEGVPLAGFAEFPGGKLLSGESPQAAAVRECREETGLAVEVTGEYPSTMHCYEHGLLHIHFFRCRTANDSPQGSKPRPPFRWVESEELANLQFPAANAQLMRLLLGENQANSPQIAGAARGKSL